MLCDTQLTGHVTYKTLQVNSSRIHFQIVRYIIGTSMREKLITVESHKLEVLWTIGFISNISCSNFREVGVEVYNSFNDYYMGEIKKFPKS